MSRYETAPDQYEITWRSGHVETVLAHQVSWPGQASAFFGGQQGPGRMHFHAEINGHWTLTLACDEAELLTVRLVSQGEPIPLDPS